MNKRKIAVLFGGCSTEYEISLKSAAFVIDNLKEDLYDVIAIGITRDGEWFRYRGPIRQIADGSWVQYQNTPCILSPQRSVHGILEFRSGQARPIRIDAAFPVLHGKNGEDGTVQGLLELAGIPCVGCGSLSSALCMEKDIAHKLVSLAGIQVPPSVVLDRPGTHQEILDLTNQLKTPLFVKPIKSGSSFGVTKVSDRSKLPDAVRLAFCHDNRVVVEQAVEGFEVGCAVMGNQDLTIGEIDEIELSAGFFDYTEKYTLKTSQIHMPARIRPQIAERIKQAASTVYRTLQCTTMARIDFFLTPDEEIVFNEVNTIPGFTSHSRFPRMMKGAGLDFPDLLDSLIRLAITP